MLTDGLERSDEAMLAEMTGREILGLVNLYDWDPFPIITSLRRF